MVFDVPEQPRGGGYEPVLEPNPKVTEPSSSSFGLVIQLQAALVDAHNARKCDTSVVGDTSPMTEVFYVEDHLCRDTPPQYIKKDPYVVDSYHVQAANVRADSPTIISGFL